MSQLACTIYNLVIRMDWNAEQYHRVSEPQFEWGLQVLARVAALPVRGDESVLDAGCGTGRLTMHLAGLFPRGRVVATDVSGSMLQTFSKALNNGRSSSMAGGHRADAHNSSARQFAAPEESVMRSERRSPLDAAGPNGSSQPVRPVLVLSDFQSLPFVSAFDIIFSTAAFYWAPDHD